uniref:Uncharacterized protein n=1 Tax=Panagrolaimus superbus TaxID=310955 RepID=A0A914YA70_9BILA
MNANFFILVAFFAIVTCIFAGDQLNLTSNQEDSELSQGLRVKRGWLCWDGMVKACCNNKCKGDGCVGLMCDMCC